MTAHTPEEIDRIAKRLTKAQATFIVDVVFGSVNSAIDDYKPMLAVMALTTAALDEITAIRRSPPPTTWQPIETAPNDVSILVARDDGEVELTPADENDYEWHPYAGREEWASSPTHWMPVPPAPAWGRTDG